MSSLMLALPVFGLALSLLSGPGAAQPIPTAPPEPSCSWDSREARSTCDFKGRMTGTPTSVVGNRVIVFRKSNTGGNADSRTFLDDAVNRLAARYGFTATISEDPAVFTPVNLANAKVVIMSNGDGDVVPAGTYRNALQDFQMVNGWGMIWIHNACAFITGGWPFGQQSCVQQYFHHNPSGTQRKIFLDSGTAENPQQGIKSPQTEFLLRNLPGWDGARSLPTSDEFFCFQAPARNTDGVNVLLGYDRSSGLPSSGCPNQNDPGEKASQDHNLAWTHKMGNGISIVNSLGHDITAYTAADHMGDSLLWRLIRYAAKDWCAEGSEEPGCDKAVGLHKSWPVPAPRILQGKGLLSLNIPEGEYAISIRDLQGRNSRAFARRGPGRMDITGLSPGLYLVDIRGGGRAWTRRFLAY